MIKPQPKQRSSPASEARPPLGSVQNFLTPEQSAKCNELKGKLHALYLRDQYEIHDKVVAFYGLLGLKYRDAQEYLMFHLLAWSTCLGFNGKFDFPHADSVEQFIESEYWKAFTKEAA